MGKIKKFTAMFVLLTLTLPVFLAANDVPADLQVALLSKLVFFYKNVRTDGGGISIYVLGDQAVLDELKTKEGKLFGIKKLVKVDGGAELPSEVPSVLFVNDEAKAADAVAYAQKNKILSVTSNPKLVNQNITLGLGNEGGKPKIILNLSSSKEEGIEWNTAILKVAETVNK